MTKYTDNQIGNFKRRWVGKEDLLEEIISILIGDGVTDNHDVIVKRIFKANEILQKEGFTPIEDKRIIYLYTGGRGVKSSIELPAIDLRGISFNRIGLNLTGIVLSGAHLEGAYFENILIAYSHFEYADLERAYFMSTAVNNSKFNNADLRGAVIHGSDLRKCNFYSGNVEGTHFIDSKIEGADFSFAKVGTVLFYIYEDPLFENKLIKKRLQTTFGSCSYLPSWKDHIYKKQISIDISHLEFRKIKQRKKYIFRPQFIDFLNHLFKSWFFTLFLKTEIDKADTTLSPDLHRYVKDQQYLIRFRKAHHFVYKIWWMFSDCGGKLSVVFFWSFMFILLFSGLYATLPWSVPSWFAFAIPDVLYINNSPINPSPAFENTETLPGFWKWFYVSFDIFSNLGIRSTYPNNPLGVILMICESIFGFMMLGMLISVLANRFARRS